ncbi:MAG: PilN domain-containing protein [Planctomycetota bacterium]|jgi:Tfp pilus assembly protein PilN
MFTVDLLKGHGIPLRSGPGGIAIAAVTVAIPIIGAIAMFGLYLHNRIIVSVQQGEIVRWEAKIAKLSDAVELHESLEKEKVVYADCLSEVKSSLDRYTQWSPVLATLVESMPNSVVLTDLEVRQHFVKREVPQKGNPEKMIDIDVPVRTLRMSVRGRPQYNCDNAVRDFQDRLRSSDFLGPRLENITVSQESDTLEGREIVSYEIDCVFRAGL